MDVKSRSHWVDYSRARDVVFERTSTEWAPWHLGDLNDKRSGRLNVITDLLGQIPYEDLTPAPLELPKRQPPKRRNRWPRPLASRPSPKWPRRQGGAAGGRSSPDRDRMTGIGDQKTNKQPDP
jgi:hypothetical protein